MSVRQTVADHDAADRQGMRRVTLSRSSTGRCHHCARTFETLAGAVSHGRSAGHLVEGTYAARYVYLPVDDPALSTALDNASSVEGAER